MGSPHGEFEIRLTSWSSGLREGPRHWGSAEHPQRTSSRETSDSMAPRSRFHQVIDSAITSRQRSSRPHTRPSVTFCEHQGRLMRSALRREIREGSMKIGVNMLLWTAHVTGEYFPHLATPWSIGLRSRKFEYHRYSRIYEYIREHTREMAVELTCSVRRKTYNYTNNGGTFRRGLGLVGKPSPPNTCQGGAENEISRIDDV